MEQRKKIIIMGAVLGGVLLAVAGFLMLMTNKGNSDSTPSPGSTAVASRPPKTVAPAPGQPTTAPPPGAPTGGKAGAPIAGKGGAGAPPDTKTSAKAAAKAPKTKPTVPASHPAPPPAKPAPAAPPTPAAAGAPAGAPVTAALPGVVTDPFVGGPAYKHKPKVGPYVDPRPWTPIMAIPAVNSTESSAGAHGKKQNDQFFHDSAVPDTVLGQAGLTGRNAGWIAVNGAQQVTAYYQDSAGNYHPVVVGSEIDGRRVTTIAKDYMVVVNQTTGETETLAIKSHH